MKIVAVGKYMTTFLLVLDIPVFKSNIIHHFLKGVDNNIMTIS